MRRSVLWPDGTPQSSSQILRCASYFQLFSQCFISWWNTASHAWYLASKIASLLHRPLEGGGRGRGRHITTCYQWVPNWLFWHWELPYLKARIWGLKATWWDSGSKVCWGCGIPKVGIWIMGLRENLGGDYGINEPLWGVEDWKIVLWTKKISSWEAILLQTLIPKMETMVPFRQSLSL